MTSLPHAKLETAPGKAPSRATLVVLPPALIEQWVAEIQKALGGSGALTSSTASDVINTALSHDAGAGDKEIAARLAKFDVVLTTYDQVEHNE